MRQCKHFRIAGHLVTARLREHSWRGWSEAPGVLAGMVSCYWETGHPKPGPTGYLVKRRMVALWVERLSDALPCCLPTIWHASSRKSPGKRWTGCRPAPRTPSSTCPC
ncbi:type VI secretion system ImpA family N-terminal domain-containing protein [Pseudomonas aeruginosa]|nr:type VI secretion system ImpA family N-terminal domain-containing protein [Pseudomonas aeruginosa]